MIFYPPSRFVSLTSFFNAIFVCQPAMIERVLRPSPIYCFVFEKLRDWVIFNLFFLAFISYFSFWHFFLGKRIFYWQQLLRGFA